MKIYDTTQPNVIETTKKLVQVANLNEELSQVLFVVGVTQRPSDAVGDVPAVFLDIKEYVLLSSLPVELREKIREHLIPVPEVST